MYLYFTNYAEGVGAPSFDKFAILKGVTLDELLSYRQKPNFERAYRECCEIRRDYLIDRALNKRFDPSFVKYLLSECESSESSDGELSLRLEIVE